MFLTVLNRLPRLLDLCQRTDPVIILRKSGVASCDVRLYSRGYSMRGPAGPLMVVSFRKVLRRGRKRNLPLLSVVFFGSFLLDKQKKGTSSPWKRIWIAATNPFRHGACGGPHPALRATFPVRGEGIAGRRGAHGRAPTMLDGRRAAESVCPYGEGRPEPRLSTPSVTAALRLPRHLPRRGRQARRAIRESPLRCELSFH